MALCHQVAREAGYVEVARLIEGWCFERCPVLLMPFDVLVLIMGHLDPFELCVVAQVCSVRDSCLSTYSLHHWCTPCLLPQDVQQSEQCGLRVATILLTSVALHRRAAMEGQIHEVAQASSQAVCHQKKERYREMDGLHSCPQLIRQFFWPASERTIVPEALSPAKGRNPMVKFILVGDLGNLQPLSHWKFWGNRWQNSNKVWARDQFINDFFKTPLAPTTICRARTLHLRPRQSMWVG